VKHDINELMTGTLSGVESSFSCLLAVVERIISIKGVYDAER
jgi:hypothetical protein